jgi:thiosulfate/3-mercaptopyruvate sulfurtransferase
LSLVISAESLVDIIHRDSSKLLIVDTRAFQDYLLGHLPGAINVDLMQFHWMDTSRKGILQFNRQMTILLNCIGVDLSETVIFYDKISGPSASRGVWLLKYFLHKKAYMLDGGYDNWINLDYPIDLSTNRFNYKKCKFAKDCSVLADFNYVLNCIEGEKEVVIIDCRSTAEYSGIIARAYHRGHIPKSINIDWARNLENEKFLKFDELERIYSFIPKQTEIITYCQGGYRASNTYIVLKNLGYKNVKMYLGSWGEWGNNPELPVE